MRLLNRSLIAQQQSLPSAVGCSVMSVMFCAGSRSPSPAAASRGAAAQARSAALVWPSNAVVGLAHPAANRLHRNVEVGSDLGLAQITAAGHTDDVTLELGRELLRHSDILPARRRPTDGVSTSPAAVPLSADRHHQRLHRGHEQDREDRRAHRLRLPQWTTNAAEYGLPAPGTTAGHRPLRVSLPLKFEEPACEGVRPTVSAERDLPRGARPPMSRCPPSGKS